MTVAELFQALLALIHDSGDFRVVIDDQHPVQALVLRSNQIELRS